ncbi:hypothetical protein C8046_07995 [Serinibacter arcticus]|uniref:Uncharacterized protein n=1 Tax=Serinibacter arcticus TaxID=1655435 RepID=A0A2U1ZUF8_9MICO|nr:hypothetical protein C8046_07995 [Serinibacter arcticus]
MPTAWPRTLSPGGPSSHGKGAARPRSRSSRSAGRRTAPAGSRGPPRAPPALAGAEERVVDPPREFRAQADGREDPEDDGDEERDEGDQRDELRAQPERASRHVVGPVGTAGLST